MNEPTPDHELAALLDALAVGGLAPEQAERLAARLRHDPAARAAYRATLEMDAMLHREFPRSTAVRLPAAVRVIRGAQPRKGTLWAAAAAIALLIAGAVALISLTRSPRRKPPARRAGR